MTDVMSKFKVGDKVQISKDSEYYMDADQANPKDTTGEVITVSTDTCMPLRVQWPFRLSGTTNSYDESDLVHAVDVVQDIGAIKTPTEATEEHTGGSSSYYIVEVKTPIAKYKLPYTAECIDIQEALNMTPAEANAFKAVWRTAAARMGKKKKGNSAVYDAEKVIFQGERMLVAAKKEDV